MHVRYHYSIFANLLFLLLGILFLFLAVDLLFLHTVISAADQPPAFVTYIILFFGILLSSGFFINFVKGKNYIIEANDEGIRIFTKSITGQLPEIYLKWNDIKNIELKRVRSTLQRSSAGRHTQAIVFSVTPGLIKWPSVMISKNKVGFLKTEGRDELMIDAWLNKRKTAIVKELNSFREAHK